MSRLEKLIIPLLDSNITSMDVTSAAGFIDSYTFDPDRPSGEKEIFLVYDDRVRNDTVTQRAIRLDSSKSLKRKYVKLVNNIPYYVYVFWITPGIKVSDKGIINLSSEQKISVLQFWNFQKDLLDYLVGDSSYVEEYTHQMPLADYYPEEYEQFGLNVPKKGAAS